MTGVGQAPDPEQRLPIHVMAVPVKVTAAVAPIVLVQAALPPLQAEEYSYGECGSSSRLSHESGSSPASGN